MSEVKETARPRFFTEPVQNMAKSEKEGRPIFDSKSFIELKHPGDKSWSFVEEIDENGMGLNRRDMGGQMVGSDYAERFPREFAAFKKGEARAMSGTPLDEWTPIPRTRVAELKAMNIFTVEEYADVQDNMLQKLGMNARAEREKARVFLAASKAGADEGKMAAEIAELRAMVERLTAPAAIPAPAAAPSDLSEPQMGEITEQREKTLEECSDSELKDYIERETGSRPRGNPNRDTLLKRAAEVAQGEVAA